MRAQNAEIEQESGNMRSISLSPDGPCAKDAHGPSIRAACYTTIVDRYGHGVLGDRGEYAEFVVLFHPKDGTTTASVQFITLSEDRVFEDIRPRIADVTGDGLNDVVVIETRLDAGASLAVYGMAGDTFAKLAATPHIGRPYRWLAPAGTADFDGDGVLDVAYVETPHIDGILRIWSFRDNEAREIASAPGYSNHRIGQNFITGGVRDCGDGPELVLPNAGWTKTLVAWLGGGIIESAVFAEDAEPQTITRALECG